MEDSTGIVIKKCAEVQKGLNYILRESQQSYIELKNDLELIMLSYIVDDQSEIKTRAVNYAMKQMDWDKYDIVEDIKSNTIHGKKRFITYKYNADKPVKTKGKEENGFCSKILFILLAFAVILVAVLLTVGRSWLDDFR